MGATINNESTTKVPLPLTDYELLCIMRRPCIMKFLCIMKLLCIIKLGILKLLCNMMYLHDGASLHYETYRHDRASLHYETSLYYGTYRHDVASVL